MWLLQINLTCYLKQTNFYFFFPTREIKNSFRIIVCVSRDIVPINSEISLCKKYLLKIFKQWVNILL